MRFRLHRNEDYDEEGNHPDNALGFDIIDIIQFNYDGQGSALYLYDGQDEIHSLSIEDVDFILFDEHYQLEIPLQRQVLIEKFMD